MAPYFASQGAWPLAPAVLRMGAAVGGGWVALRLTGLLQAVFLALGAGLPALGLGNAAAVAGGTGFRGDRS